ncbi:MAG: excinuclease subunit, partial [Bacilli bacterium]|nr:excinuclease subunit [Bacilli bacterium]
GSMREVIRRRYTRVLKEKLQLPDLIVIDGGKGQIHAALDVLINELSLEIPVCSLAKDERHRTSQLFFMDDPEPVNIRTTSQAFYLLTRIQDEVHRFAITFYRQQHSKEALKSILDEIPGVGEQRRKTLLKHFGSIDAMRGAEVDEFRKIGIGEKLALDILNYLRN